MPLPPSPVPIASTPPERTARYAFILLFLLYMFDYIDRMVVVSLFPYIKQDWGLSDTQLGLLISAVYWSILVFTLPVSILIDRWSRKKCIGIMAVVWSLATIACAFTRNFGQLFAARVAIGVGEAGYAPGGTAMISALYPKEKRARMLGIWNASIPLGSAIGIALGGFVAQHLGWKHAFGLVALPGMIVALLFFGVRDYKTIDLTQTPGAGPAGGQRMTFSEIVAEFTRKPSLIFSNLAMASCVFVTTSLLTWLPTYFHRVQGLDMTKAGLKGSAVMLLAIVGAPLGGYLTDRWYRRRKRARLLFPALSSLATGVLLFVTFGLLGGTSQYAVLLLSGIAATAFIPAAVAVTQDVVHPGLRAVSLSLNVIIQHILGSAVGPPVIGALSDRLGLAGAMTFLPAFAILAALLFLAGSVFYPRDLDKVAPVEVPWENGVAREAAV
jgi:MFS family permease